jgi:hypothetical protein
MHCTSSRPTNSAREDGSELIPFYDRDGHPIDLLRFGKLFNDLKYRVIAQDHVNDITVSTVWLGLDHSMSGGPPLIFETMIFDTADLDHPGHDLEMRRYSTESEAREGHRQLLELVNLLEFTQTGETDDNDE